jgi:diguanylate cyclase (GGDEF)-like protein
MEARGGRKLHTDTLFLANIAILWVMAAAFLMVGRHRSGEPYWSSWFLANLVLGAALLMFLLEAGLPDVLVAAVPNGLLVLGLGLRWRAAREFGRRPAPNTFVWGPCLLFIVVCAVPWVSGSYGAVFTIVNGLLTGLCAAIAWEFWRDRRDGLPSRWGLVVAYSVLGLSFGARTVQGIHIGSGMEYGLPHDVMLAIHLGVAVVHCAASGAFSLSLAHERANAELRHAATHDALTGLLNRGAFEDETRERLARADANGFSLALLDIDHFKQINDRLGHAAGDEALRRCGQLLRQLSREGDVVARVGGEEFALLLPDAGIDETHAIIDRMRRGLAASDLGGAGAPLSLTVSAGICDSRSAAYSFDVLMRMADEALYAAKSKGRNRVELVAA